MKPNTFRIRLCILTVLIARIPVEGTLLIHEDFSTNSTRNWSFAGDSTVDDAGGIAHMGSGTHFDYGPHNGVMRWRPNHTGTHSDQASLIYRVLDSGTEDASEYTFSTTGIHAQNSRVEIRLAIRYEDAGTKWAISNESIRTSTGTSAPVPGSWELSSLTFSALDFSDLSAGPGAAVDTGTVLQNASGIGVYSRFTRQQWQLNQATQLNAFTVIPASGVMPLTPLEQFAAQHSRLAETDDKGRIVPRTAPVPEEVLNPVHSEAWFEGLLDRKDLVLRTSLTQPFHFNTWFENEKYSLGQAMARAIAGDYRGFSCLYAEDANARDWHMRTEGIDFYACFVIKHQPRKYFHFGPLLPPDYVRRMREGGRAWTERDPLHRPSDLYRPGSEGWTPSSRNSWVDVRTTDNLSMMRFVAVYLFAEETGSEEVRLNYKQRLTRFATAIYRAGNGEWDSENYLGHTIAPIFNLHDFARDSEVRDTGKAMLDWFLAAAALKYYRGGAVGPNSRDHNHVQPFGGSLAEMAWFYFGAPNQPEEFEYDVVHALSSSYVPPPAVVNLGTQNFERPRELLNSKPSYREPQLGDYQAPAAYHETFYIGRHFVLGSLAEGMTQGGSVNGFKIALEDSRRGLADLRFAPTANANRTGSAAYRGSNIAGLNRVAQNRDVAIYFAKGDALPWRASLPETVATEVVDGVTFLRGETSWAAVFPINLRAPLAADEEATHSLQFAERRSRRNVEVTDPETGERRREQQEVVEMVPRHPHHYGLAGQGGEGFSGFAIEIGEQPDFEDYEAFKRAVLTRANLDVSELAAGTVAFTGAGGRAIKATWSDRLEDFRVWRDGELHDWAEHARYVYRETGRGADGLIHQRRGPEGGTLTINAGGQTFVGSYSTDGRFTFSNE